MSATRVLVVDDSADDAELEIRALTRAGRRVEWEVVETREAAAAELARGWDIVLCDYSMPNFSAPEMLRLLSESGDDVPCIIVSGAIGEERAAEVVRLGARDYVFKNNLLRLPASVDRALREAQAAREHRAVRERLAILDAVIESATDIVLVIEPAREGERIECGRIVYANRATLTQFGYEVEEVVGRSLEMFEGFRGDAERIAHMCRGLSEYKTVRFELMQKRRDGTPFWAEVSIEPVRRHDGTVSHFALIQRDIGERKRAQHSLLESEARLRLMIEQLPALIWTTDLELRVASLEGTEFGALGIDREAALNKPVGDTLFRSDAMQPLALYAHRQALNGSPFRFEFESGGRIRQALVEPLRNAEHRIAGAIGIALDITEQRETAERLARLTSYDQVTQLPNRTLFVDRVAQAIAFAHRYQRRVAVAFMDVDRFKTVNDSLGHGAGDSVLRSVGERLASLVREGDTIARFSGDEFAVVLADAQDRETAGSVAQRMVDSFAVPFRFDEREFYLTSSVGIAMYPDDAGDAPSLLRNAERAMYEAKRLGRNACTFYVPTMPGAPSELLRLHGDLWRALEADEFAVLYQPIFTIGGALAGVEALVRWQHPALGLMLPDSFIPLAEESGLIEPIGAWVLDRALADLASWLAQGVDPGRLSVNVSARQFERPGLRATVARALERYAVEPPRLELEITETSIMRDVAATIRTLCELKELGVRLSIDDFGTGYTSLSYLKRFPIDVLKIDRSFVRDLGSGPYDEAIVRAITMLAQIMEFTTVAEGVERTGQLERLRLLECDEVQGYLLGAPMSAGDLIALVRSGTPFPAKQLEVVS